MKHSKWKCFKIDKSNDRTKARIEREKNREEIERDLALNRIHFLLKHLWNAIFRQFKSMLGFWFCSLVCLSMKLSVPVQQQLRWAYDNKAAKKAHGPEINFRNTMHVFELRIYFQLQLWCWLNSKNKPKIPECRRTATCWKLCLTHSIRSFRFILVNHWAKKAR